MPYKQFRPDPALSPYIDAFWEVTSDENKTVPERIMPDCCMDIIMNLGTDVLADGNGGFMKNDRAYLVGTMTRFKDTAREPQMRLVGTRFKPGGFHHFFNYGPLNEFTDKVVDFEKSLVPSFHLIGEDFTSPLNHFFLRKLSPAGPSIFHILRYVYERKGQIHVAELAKNQFMTVRQLERIFLRQLGISPKTFINFVRYQFALQKIQVKIPSQSFDDLSVDCGYYDHAHLANEIKKYTGVSPSEL